MRIVATRHLNLHSKSSPGGLVHLTARVSKTVPDDVQEHPLFDRLVDAGVIALLKAKEKPAPAEVEPDEEEETDPEISLVDKDGDEDEDETEGAGEKK